MLKRLQDQVSPICLVMIIAGFSTLLAVHTSSSPAFEVFWIHLTLDLIALGMIACPITNIILKTLKNSKSPPGDLNKVTE